jgi:hypothetical protein
LLAARLSALDEGIAEDDRERFERSLVFSMALQLALDGPP